MQNTQALHKFIELNNFMNHNSTIEFIAYVSIKTNNNHLKKKKMRVNVNYYGYDNSGKLNLLDDSLDPYSYPTQFDANFQRFECIHAIDENYLSITGTHKKNHDIGDYEVKISPLK